jgi:hypothetical protein
MIITRDEANKMFSKKINTLLRFTKRPPELASAVEFQATLDDGKRDTVARGLIKSVREVDIYYFMNNKDAILDHGVMSLNGLKRHISELYSNDLWDSFVAGKTKLTRIKIDYALNQKKPPEKKTYNG